MSAQHRWLQQRIVRLFEQLNLDAIPEHWATRSDVFVPARNLSIEVQRWSTDFEKRTRARAAQGAKVIWLLPVDAQVRDSRALFNLPAARLVVHAAGQRQVELCPWEDPRLNSSARLSVSATVTTGVDGEGYLQTGAYDALRFFRELASGSRSWFAPGAVPHRRSSGLWVLDAHLDAARETRKLKAASSQVPTNGATATDPDQRHSTEVVIRETPQVAAILPVLERLDPALESTEASADVQSAAHGISSTRLAAPLPKDPSSSPIPVQPRVVSEVMLAPMHVGAPLAEEQSRTGRRSWLRRALFALGAGRA